VDLYAAESIEAYTTITVPSSSSSWMPRWLLRRIRRPEFHFIYDLASAPVGGSGYSRISQMAVEAKRLVRPDQLGDCYDQLYSSTTDLLGVIQLYDKSKDRKDEDTKVDVINLDLDKIELRYLHVPARMLYWAGVMYGLMAVVACFLIGIAGGGGVVAVMALLGGLGATVSVIQRMSDDKS